MSERAQEGERETESEHKRCVVVVRIIALGLGPVLQPYCYRHMSVRCTNGCTVSNEWIHRDWSHNKTDLTV